MNNTLQKWDKDEVGGISAARNHIPKVVPRVNKEKEYDASIEEEKDRNQKQLMNTGITFQHERLLLETDSQEKLDAFKAAYHRLERHYLGDYGG